MLWTTGLILLILWLPGFFTARTFGVVIRAAARDGDPGVFSVDSLSQVLDDVPNLESAR
jgi:hypothetical protein